MSDRMKSKPHDSIKVLYIGGWQRSGSTILGNILNEAEGLFHVGELCFVWYYGLTQNFLCGCGRPFRSCPLWQSIFEQAFGSIERMRTFRPDRPSSQKLLLNLLGILPDSRLINHDYLHVLSRLYQSIHQVTGCRYIVDSSKFPAHAYLLQQIPSVELHMLHLIRDPRGTAYSWQRKLVRHDMREDQEMMMPRFNVIDTSLKWMLWNIDIQLLGRSSTGYLRVRYEDFAQTPMSCLKRIITFIGEDIATVPQIANKMIMMGLNHTVMGNPNRAKSGAVNLRLDVKWKQEMRKRDRALVNLIDWPLMLKYGYPLG